MRSALLLLLLGGCASGPQLPIGVPVVNISCTWNLQDGGTADDCDCLIDRSSADSAQQTHGVQTGPVDVSPHTQVSTGANP